MDFLTETVEADIVVTNPPFSLKDQFLRRAYSLGKPFALLMPADALVGLKRHPLYVRYGAQLLIPDRRIHFISDRGWSANFNTLWFCWRLLPKDVIFVAV